MRRDSETGDSTAKPLDPGRAAAAALLRRDAAALDATCRHFLDPMTRRPALSMHRAAVDLLRGDASTFAAAFRPPDVAQAAAATLEFANVDVDSSPRAVALLDAAARGSEAAAERAARTRATPHTPSERIETVREER